MKALIGWLATLTPALAPETLLAMQRTVPGVHVADALLDYVQALLRESRRAANYRSGLSPRAGLALLRGAQAWATLEGRDHVLPEDIQTVLPAVVGHRLHPADASRADTPAELAETLLQAVAIP